MTPRRLCRFDDLADPGSAAFTLEGADGDLPVMVIRRGGQVFGYINRCPHIGAPLDWREGQFLDARRRFILCASHGALFQIEDGGCIGGPCAGKSLEPVDLLMEDGQIWAAGQAWHPVF